MPTLKSKAIRIQNEMNEKLLPENIKSGVTIFNVVGELQADIEGTISTAIQSFISTYNGSSIAINQSKGNVSDIWLLSDYSNYIKQNYPTNGDETDFTDGGAAYWLTNHLLDFGIVKYETMGSVNRCWQFVVTDSDIDNNLLTRNSRNDKGLYYLFNFNALTDYYNGINDLEYLTSVTENNVQKKIIYIQSDLGSYDKFYVGRMFFKRYIQDISTITFTNTKLY